MEITWYGQTCFRLSERGLAAVVTDPYPPNAGLTFPRPRANVVTVSHDDPQCCYTKGVRGPFKLLDGPGEYEIGGVFITGITTFADGKHGASRGLNTIFTFDFAGLTVCHLGRLGHVPTQSQVEGLGAVNILLVPVGGS
jgi:L-ascorbate metabolism protein UlaG (beta-lactamase superfamily)